MGRKGKLNKVEAKLNLLEKQHFINEKGETNFAYTDDRGTDSLDKDSLKQLKETEATSKT